MGVLIRYSEDAKKICIPGEDKLTKLKKNILTVKISEKNYELVKIFSRKNNQYTKDNFTKSELVDMGLTLLFKELNNIKVKDLKIRPSIKKYDVKKYLNDGCDSNE